MIVTMLEARIDDENAGRLVDSFAANAQPLPPAIVESFLLRESEGDLWRIATVWQSREVLDEYRSSVDTPGGVLMFRSAGAEPTLTVFEVLDHAAHT